MRILLKTLLFTTALAFAAETAMTVDQLVGFIKSSVKLHQPDKQVADYLHHVHLTNRLDDRTIEDLQGLGAGPKTLIALRDLRDASANLSAAPAAPPPPAAPAQAPPPDSIEQAKIIDAARDYAMNYTKQLPNYLCMQITRRYIDRDVNDALATATWEMVDSFITRLTYFDQKEDYKVVMVNDRAVTDTPMEKLGGTTTMGEFGSMMKEIFDRDSDALFGWDHWATLRGRPMYVFSYEITQPHSKYTVWAQGAERITPGYRGLVYVDKDTNMIERLTLEPQNLPTGYPVKAIKVILDYDFTKIGENEYLVPLKSTVMSRLSRYLSRNDVEFRLYKKFGTETTIKFGDVPPPISDDKLKEKP